MTGDDHAQWVARYMRHGAQYDYECRSPEEALIFLTQGNENDTLAYDSILRPDGTVALDKEQIFKVSYAYIMDGRMGQRPWRELLAEILAI